MPPGTPRLAGRRTHHHWPKALRMEQVTILNVLRKPVCSSRANWHFTRILETRMIGRAKFGDLFAGARGRNGFLRMGSSLRKHCAGISGVWLTGLVEGPGWHFEGHLLIDVVDWD